MRSERLRDALNQPTGPRRGTRSAADKRRSLARLLDRYNRDSRSWWVSLALLVCLVGAIAIVVGAMGDSSDLVEYVEDPEAYARLAVALESACEAPMCAYGWSGTGRPPSEIRRLMGRLRVRDAHVAIEAGRVTLMGAYGAAFAIVHHAHPPGISGRRRTACIGRAATTLASPGPHWATAGTASRAVCLRSTRSRYGRATHHASAELPLWRPIQRAALR